METSYIWDFCYSTYRRRDNSKLVEEHDLPVELIPQFINKFNLKLNSLEQFDSKMYTTAEESFIYYDNGEVLGLAVHWEGALSIFSKAEWQDIDWEDPTNCV
jgi:hypothetical protein